MVALKRLDAVAVPHLKGVCKSLVYGQQSEWTMFTTRDYNTGINRAEWLRG